MIIVSTGCPAGVGPEVTLAAASRRRDYPCVLVGDESTLRAAANLVGVDEKRLEEFVGQPKLGNKPIYWLQEGPALSKADRRPGRPSKRAGRAQLLYIERAYQIAKARGAALVTGPVSKSVIARSGLARAKSFIGHTEWLQQLDEAKSATMCFASEEMLTGLVTTHLPLHEVPEALTPEAIATACVDLAKLACALSGEDSIQVAVASLNPHAGEGELLGEEERRAIVPGLRRARRKLPERVNLVGPIGAETAYRKLRAGEYAAVLAMYHDQATIPMKLVAFGDAVNVTVGLSVVRTSVDHGTGYDIAWQALADASGMSAAMRLAARLTSSNSQSG